MRIVVAMTGATGAAYGVGLLAVLAELMARETPLSDIHLQNMLALSRMGAIAAPPVPAFCNNPQTIDDLIDHNVGRVLDLFGLEMPKLRRWTGMRAKGEHASAVEPLPATNGS
jgi:4-hydroxy-3-polyprenylbenzoate decarboxylase